MDNKEISFERIIEAFHRNKNDIPKPAKESYIKILKGYGEKVACLSRKEYTTYDGLGNYAIVNAEEANWAIVQREEVLPKSSRERLHNIQENKEYESKQ